MATEISAPTDTESPYQSLYRRYRPQRFSEVRGQEHVALALRNAVRDERVAHAYLFSGPRGTGKTSTARILAKALDCESPEDGEPCGRCASCLSITAGSSFDVHELDAASNNGVDAMRDLVTRSTLATPGRWKVYIVDEVHMLSTQASNALLKTLEEPPEHVVFVLATTDPQKVLPTIRSRTQHYEFHLINESILDDLLADIAKDAGLDLPEGAVSAAVRRARGSARDALSVLDQVAAAGIIEDSTDSVNEVVIAMGKNDTAALLIAINTAMDAGHDAQQLGVDVIERLRAGFLAQFNANTAMPLTPTERDQVLSLGTARCVRAMELIGESIVAMRDAPEPRITLEVAMIRCTHPEAETGADALVERIERLERRLAGAPNPGDISVASPAQPAPIQPAQTQPVMPALSVTEPAIAPLTTESPATPTPAPATNIDSPEPTTPEPTTPEPTTPGPRPSLGAFRRGEQASPKSSAAPTATLSPSVSAPDSPIQPETTETATATATATTDSSQGVPPTLETLVNAWEGQILSALRPKARAIYQATRFVGIEDRVALAGLPNAAHILHAEPLRRDIEAALRAHFGTDLTLKLVVSTTQSTPAPGTTEVARATTPPPSAGNVSVSDEDYVDDNEDDLEDLGQPLGADEADATPTTNVAWAEDQLRAAFPGAEEI